jgi:NIMA (never in mitosis gene a)-related kinase
MITLKPPFRAEDMDGLYKKVIKGSYSKIGDNYSKQLSAVIKSMLQVNPANRPDAGQLLASLAEKAEDLDINIELDENKEDELLRTIRVNKNLHYLTDRLPKSNYDNGHEIEKNNKLTPNTTKQKHAHSNGHNISTIKGINLPKLDRIIIKNNSNKLAVLE